MRLLFGTMALVLLILIATMGFLLSRPAHSPLHEDLLRDSEQLLATVGDPSAREATRARAEAVARYGTGFLAQRSIGNRLTAGPALATSTIRASLASATLPIFLAVALLGTLLGLLRRHVLRETWAYHSTTFSYVGKLILALSMAAYAFTAFSPLAPPVWTLYLFSLTGGGGAILYFGNLPPRL